MSDNRPLNYSKEVPSKLYEPTSATIRSQWKKPPDESTQGVPKPREPGPPPGTWDDAPLDVKASAWRKSPERVRVTPPAAFRDVAPKVYEQRPQRGRGSDREHDDLVAQMHVIHPARFEHVASRLMVPTAASEHGRWEGDRARSPTRIPSPVKRRGGLGAPAPALAAQSAFSKKYANVQSKLTQPTAASIRGSYEWKVPDDETPQELLEAGWNTHHGLTKASKNAIAAAIAAQDGNTASSLVASPTGLPAASLYIGGVDGGQLPVPPPSHKYSNVKSRLMEPTSAAINSQWQAQPSAYSNGPEEEEQMLGAGGRRASGGLRSRSPTSASASRQHTPGSASRGGSRVGKSPRSPSPKSHSSPVTMHPQSAHRVGQYYTTNANGSIVSIDDLLRGHSGSGGGSGSGAKSSNSSISTNQQDVHMQNYNPNANPQDSPPRGISPTRLRLPNKVKTFDLPPEAAAVVAANASASATATATVTAPSAAVRGSPDSSPSVKFAENVPVAAQHTTPTAAGTSVKTPTKATGSSKSPARRYDHVQSRLNQPTTASTSSMHARQAKAQQQEVTKESSRVGPTSSGTNSKTLAKPLPNALKHGKAYEHIQSRVYSRGPSTQRTPSPKKTSQAAASAASESATKSATKPKVKHDPQARVYSTATATMGAASTASTASSVGKAAPPSPQPSPSRSPAGGPHIRKINTSVLSPGSGGSGSSSNLIAGVACSPAGSKTVNDVIRSFTNSGSASASAQADTDAEARQQQMQQQQQQQQQQLQYQHQQQRQQFNQPAPRDEAVQELLNLMEISQGDITGASELDEVEPVEVWEVKSHREHEMEQQWQEQVGASAESPGVDANVAAAVRAVVSGAAAFDLPEEPESASSAEDQLQLATEFGLDVDCGEAWEKKSARAREEERAEAAVVPAPVDVMKALHLDKPLEGDQMEELADFLGNTNDAVLLLRGYEHEGAGAGGASAGADGNASQQVLHMLSSPHGAAPGMNNPTDAAPELDLSAAGVVTPVKDSTAGQAEPETVTPKPRPASDAAKEDANTGSGSKKFARTAPVSTAATSQEETPAASLTPQAISRLSEGFMVLKKLGSEKKYVTRFVWIDAATTAGGASKLHWCKGKTKNEWYSKSIELSGDSVLSIVRDADEPWTDKEALMHIMMSPTVSITGSSKNIAGAKDCSIDICFTPETSEMRATGSSRVLSPRARKSTVLTEAEAFYDGVTALIG